VSCFQGNKAVAAGCRTYLTTPHQHRNHQLIGHRLESFNGLKKDYVTTSMFSNELASDRRRKFE
jgi:hypothetical protein